MLRFWSKKSKTGGFSLAELLAVVAILGILAAIAIPSAVKIQRDLKLLELNDTARQIFIAAQNQLTALRGADGLNAVSPDGGAEKVDTPDGMDNIYYTQSKAGAEDKQFAAMMPTGAIDSTILDGQQMVVIEYNPDSASVYAVFYAEAPFTYDPADMPRNDDAGKTERRENLIGYYGGDAAGIPSIDVIAEPKIALQNGEELKLTISFKDVIAEAEKKNPNYRTEVLENLKYTVEVQQADKKENYKKITKPGTDSAPIEFLNGDYTEGTLILDSLDSKHFATLMQDSTGFAIDPGSDITVKVTIDFTDSANHQSVPVKWESQVENSLFKARVTEKDDDPGTVQVACGRHLQNLEERISGVSTAADSKYRVEKVEQTAKIDWQPYIDKHAQVTEYKLGDISAGGTTPQITFAENAFISITNPTIQSFTGSEAGIHNLWINENDDEDYGSGGKIGKSTGLFAGLIGKKAPIQLKNISLVNPFAEANNVQKFYYSVGVLVGYAENVSFENCRAYIDESGLEKWISKKRTYGANAPIKLTAPYVGGLIGHADKVVLNRCFAALPAVTCDTDSWGVVGGLIGQVSGEVGGSTINESYADTLKLAGTNVGGFVGEMQNSVVQNCYAVSQIEFSSNVSPAGFCWGFTGSIARNCYAAVTLNSENPDYLKRLYGFAATSKTMTNTTFDGCYYVADVVNGPLYPEKVEVGQPQPVSYERLKNWAGFGTKDLWSGSDKDNTNEYNMKPFEDLGALQSKVDKELYGNHEEYPFPHLAAFDHYGDWPLPAKRGALVYYEVYENGETIGMHGFGADGTAFVSGHPLKNNAGVVVRDGYAYVGYAQAANLRFGGTNSITVVKDEALTKMLDMTDITVCPIKYEDLIGPALHSSSFYRQLSVNDVKTKLYFNPYVAKAVVYQTEDEAPTLDGAASIRSARQLAALGELGKKENLLGLSLTQELDIDFTKYDMEYAAALALYPIGTKEDAAFTGSYDGQFHQITGTGIDGGEMQYVGLFGYAKGSTLVNIVFRDADKSITGGANVGALAGYNGGTIRNCAVAGLTVTANGTAGGLVGYNVGTIINSSAACKQVRGNQASGIVGALAQSGKIESSYATGTLSANGAVFGIASANSASAKIINCYSACTVDKAQSVIGVAQGEGVDDCYYLKNTIQPTQPYGEVAEGLSYDELADFNDFGGRADEAHTFPYSSTPPYPFPAFVENANGEYVHYGDWPEKGEEPEKTFGDVVIGVCVRKGVNESRQETSFEIWGINKDGEWSDKAVTTFTVNKAVYVAYFTCTGPGMSGNGRWYFWNSQLGGDTEAKHLPEVTAANDITLSGYKFYTANNLHVAGQKTYFYDKKPDGKGNPPAGWDFALTNSDPPKYEANN
ncbi:type II secretion system protein [Agathobaculum sp. NTUH-O15-33]|uniref:type II secretion system protein n=1 Tax=Agathobaculum sp. NTUH-O15-33 TaxID=3079302 RepID=UPI0029586684|nr:type II secretion system protein [Agathobaculum sp. NTUH-O15-33]WNX84415.1 type II secretion system protein [Agathobaculum sp. NTUH-O15-33]